MRRKGEAEPEKTPPPNDVVPKEVEWVEVWHGGREIARLLPMPPPGAGELVMVNGAIRRVHSRAYFPERRTARLEVV
jgi:hypothetical protein